MRITSIRLKDFRSYSAMELEPAGLTVLVGPNASGKTNLIEAIQLATTARSFRSSSLDQVVKWGSPCAGVKIEAHGDSLSPTLEVEVTAEGRRTHKVNGKPKRRLADVVGIVPCVVFTPDDLRLVKGSADGRRSGLDDICEQVKRGYASLRRDYGRAVRQRNLLLKEGAPSNQTEPWTEQVSELGGKIVATRTDVLGALSGAVSEAYRAISSGEALAVAYVSRAADGALEGPVGSTEAASSIRASLEARGTEELARRTTLAGPHRDDISFYIEERGARAFASQGQQRSVALAWKVGCLKLLEERTGRRPILLLDDVMSELDEDRRTALASLVEERTQTFMTTTNLGYFDPATLMGAEVIELG